MLIYNTVFLEKKGKTIYIFYFIKSNILLQGERDVWIHLQDFNSEMWS